MDTIERLRQLMSERGWTAYRLSKECGLSQSTLANILKRNAQPSIATLEELCAGFGITLSQFFANDGDLVELTPELSKLFEQWRPLTPQQKTAVYQLLKAFNDNDLTGSK